MTEGLNHGNLLREGLYDFSFRTKEEGKDFENEKGRGDPPLTAGTSLASMSRERRKFETNRCGDPRCE